MHTCALCFRNEKKKRRYRWETFHRYYRPLINCHHLCRSWMMNHFIDTVHIKEPVWRAALCESVKVSLFLWPAIPPQIEQAHYPCPSSYAGLVKLLYWLLIVTCRSVNPPTTLQKRAKSCEHQRHWRWRPFTLIPRVAHSHTDSLKESVSWIHKLIGSTTNPSSVWLLIQLLCSKNRKWAGQETGMQPWRTTHSVISTSKGENLGKVCSGENESHKSRVKSCHSPLRVGLLCSKPVHLFNKPSYFFLYELCASGNAAGF